MAVSLLVKQYITESHPDVKIVCTREKDVFIGLNERADIANRANANLFISIHANSLPKGNSQVQGAEVFTFGLDRSDENLEAAKRENSVILLEDDYKQKYEGFDPESSESYIIFEFMQNKFVEQSVSFASTTLKELTGSAGRRDRGVRQAAFLVLRKSTMPRILIELDFISNPEAETFMLSSEGQKSLARAISRAFTKYKRDFDRKSVQTAATTADDNRPVETEPPTSSPDSADSVAAAEANNTETIVKENIIPDADKPSKPDNKTVYKIQILASVDRLPAGSHQLKGYRESFFREGKWYKYTVGETSDRKEILTLLKSVSKKFPDAFVVAFRDEKKIRFE